jgi:putative membrane protein
VLNAVKVLDLQVIGVFAAGCVVGLLSIANLLSWAFRHYREQTLAVLTGIMVGALNKVWPWKQVVSWREDSHGGKVPFLDQNVLPATYTEVTGADPLVALAILSALCGVALVLMIELMGRRSTNPAASNS